MVFPSARGENKGCNEINPIPNTLSGDIMSDTTSTHAPAEKSFGRELSEQSTIALATSAAAVVGLFGAAAAAQRLGTWREKRAVKKSAKKAQKA